MEDVVACLRQGALESRRAPLVLVEDSVEAVGSQAVFSKILRGLVRACTSGRAQCLQVCHVDVEGEANQYMAPLQRILGHALVQKEVGLSARENGPLADLLEQIVADAPATARAHTNSTTPCPPTCCVVLNSLSGLLFMREPAEVLAFMHDMLATSAVSSILAVLHVDLHEGHVIAGLEAMAACLLRLHPAPALPAVRMDSSGSAEGRLDVAIPRRSGRLRKATQLYRMLPDGDVISWEPGDDVAPHERDFFSGPLGAPAAGPAGMEQIGGGMRHTLTDEERAARGRVLLPHEDVQKEELQKTADGPADRAGQLGTIQYERDSGSEHDSDEDPDDDLDI